MEEQPKPSTSTAETAKTAVPETKGSGKSSSTRIVLIIAAVVLVLAALVYLFIRLGPETTGDVRDIMVIIFALESVVTAAAFVVLCIQLVKLVVFLKNDIQPILSTTTKTVKKVSGTVSFLCDNAVEPTVNAASTISGIKNAANGIVSVFRK